MYDEHSRYKHSIALQDENGAIFLDIRPRMLYMGGYDEILHEVVLGDTLHNLAQRYYGAFPEPAGLWWTIAEFQPEPINDPTVRLEPGTWLVIPSVDTIQQWLMSMTYGQGEGLQQKIE